VLEKRRESVKLWRKKEEEKRKIQYNNNNKKKCEYCEASYIYIIIYF
jgi:hypothetical protein